MTGLKKVSCPNCQQKYRLPESREDRQVACRNCKSQFVVTGSTDDGGVSPDNDRGGVFDSIDIDSMLNAESSGLEQARVGVGKKRRQKQEKPPKPKNNRQPKSTVSSSSAARRDKPDVISAVATRAAAAKGRADEQTNNAAVLDPEEAAVFAYAAKHNRRKNRFAIFVGLIFAVGVGGFFFKQELENLRQPLTDAERQTLEDQGFRLVAVEQMGGRFGKLNDGIARVEVVPGMTPEMLGRSKERVKKKQFEKKAEPFDPNRDIVDDRPRKNGRRNNVRREIPIDFDTRIQSPQRELSDLFGINVQSRRSNVGAMSKRGHFYFADGPTVRVYDLKARKAVGQKTIRLSRDISAITVSRDNQWLTVGLDSGALKLFQIQADGNFYESRTLSVQMIHRISRIAVSPDSKRWAATDTSGAISVWSFDSDTPTFRYSPKAESGKSLDLAWSSNDEVVVAYGQSYVTVDSKLGLATTASVTAKRNNAVLAPAADVAISTDANSIIAYRINTDDVVWKKTTRRGQRPLIAVNSDGSSGFFGDGGPSVLLFDLKTGAIIAPTVALINRVNSSAALMFSPDAGYLLATNGQNKWQVAKLAERFHRPFDAEELPSPRDLPLPDYPSAELLAGQPDYRKRVGLNGTTAAFSFFGRGLIGVATENGLLSVYDWTRTVLIDELQFERNAHVTAVTSFGDYLIAGHRDGRVSIYRWSEIGKLFLVERFKAHDDAVSLLQCFPPTVVGAVEVAVAPTEKGNDNVAQIVSISDRGHLIIRGIAQKENRYDRTPFQGNPQDIVITSDGEMLVASNSQLAVINLKTSKTKVMGSRKSGDHVAISPDGRRLALSNGRKLSIAKTSSGAVSDAFDLIAAPKGIRFLPGGKSVALFYDGRIDMMKIRNGKVWNTIRIDVNAAGRPALVVSNDGRLMASFSKRSETITILPAPLDN